MKPNKASKSGPKKCGAKRRKGGKCEKYPMKEKERCGLHGGKSTGAKTVKGMAIRNAAPLKHGAYSKMFRTLLSQSEKKAHKEIIEGLESDEFKAADKIMRESIAMLLITASKMDDPARILGEVRNQLKDLKVSRVGREGEKLPDGVEIKRIEIITSKETKTAPVKMVIPRRTIKKEK